MDRKVRGMTIVELVVVMVIVSILASGAIYWLVVQINRERLRAGTNQLMADINDVKLKSISSGAIWGIRVCSGSPTYKVFIDHDGNCRDVNTTCSPDTTKRCLNNPLATCSSDANCINNTGPCVVMERSIALPNGVVPQNNFYAVFDRRGYALDYSCGLGHGNITLRGQLLNFSNLYDYRYICVSRFGRVKSDDSPCNPEE